MGDIGRERDKEREKFSMYVSADFTQQHDKFA